MNAFSLSRLEVITKDMFLFQMRARAPRGRKGEMGQYGARGPFGDRGLIGLSGLPGVVGYPVSTSKIYPKTTRKLT